MKRGKHIKNSIFPNNFNVCLKWPLTNVLFVKKFFLCLLLPFSFSKTSNSQTISFNFRTISETFCAPATIQFTPTFSSTPLSFYWELGVENEESEQLNPIFTYSAPGNYRVTLVALFENQLLETTRIVNIHGPANFTIDPDKLVMCKPESVNFKVTSTLPLFSLEWDFGDGTNTSTGSGNEIEHTYSNFGGFGVTLTAIDARGCVGSASVGINIRRPTATLSDSPRIGCLPAQVNFSAIVNVLPTDPVIEYRWNFGDGSPQVTNGNNTLQYTFTTPNTYFPKLSILTKNGCSNTFDFPSLSFGDKPSRAIIKTALDTICASELPIFQVENVNNATDFKWEISTGDVRETKEPTLIYKFTDLDEFQVKVTPSFNGCEGEADSLRIVVKGVIADYRFNNSCTNRAFFDFRSVAKGNISRHFWDFGDGGPTASTARPAREYPPLGSFPLLYRVTDNITGCEDSIKGMIYTAISKLVGTDTFICRNSQASLRIIDNYQNPRVVMNWTVLGRNFNNSPNNSLEITATNAGIFSNRVIINNGTGYCRDTLVQPDLVRVAGPVSQFATPVNSCLNESMRFTNLSRSLDSLDRVIGWSWNFGNDQFSDKQFPEPIDYFAVGNYRVSLTVTDNKGCMDSSSSIIRIRRLPILRVFPLNQKICEGQEVQLTALHKTNLRWSPANLVSCDTCAIVTVKPTVPTTYTVTTSDIFGCSRSQDVNLDIWYDFDFDSNVIRDTTICAGSSVSFNLKVDDKIITWTPTLGLTSTTIPNPIATPLNTTTYKATVADSGNCFIKTTEAKIEVNPLPQVDIGPNLVLAYDQPFTLSPIYGSNISSYQWLPANLLSCSNCPFPSGRAQVSTDFSLIATTDKGCSQSFMLNLTIDCSEKNLLMPSGFTPNGDGLNDVFYPLVRGVRIINRFMIYNRFGQLVYERRNFPPNDKSYGWDGKISGKPQPVGSYVYYVEAECDLGQNLSAKGTVSILR